ncbi:hypothetical protein C483_02386 [Natrialba hulunbeirensis JCM 10989]|uniref:Halobacterial output domain-containing protein n=1 Tax=Natrialba hulunbeirensis JCM 10989 TaxID=1227493 RepID=M0A8T4_9EURY|nr:HalOD1 output domain-containing protein [Natrialba hulunbeirensis]ELY95175.1 hypothetical protein C483_02386 [Natrialba hulunbeirensis JCM 10989]
MKQRAHSSTSTSPETTESPSETADTADRPTADDNQFTFQADTEQPPSVAVISAIAAQDDLDVLAVADELEPLYNAVDPAALDALFADSSDASELDRAGGSVTFAYAGRTVTVDTTGRVVLEEME